MKYLFLNSYLDAREKHIADKTDFERMMGSKDHLSALQILQDTDYGVHALDSKDLEEIILKEKMSFRDDLFKMGFSLLAELYLLKDSFTNLRLFLKGREDYLPSGKGEKQLKEDFSEIIEKLSKIKDKEKRDDHLTEIYLEKIRDYGEKEVKEFVENYLKVLKTFSKEEREEKLRDLEKSFILENRKKNEGLSPILAYFLQKWIAEKTIRAIIRGKEAGLTVSQLKEVISNIRAL